MVTFAAQELHRLHAVAEDVQAVAAVALSERFLDERDVAAVVLDDEHVNRVGVVIGLRLFCRAHRVRGTRWYTLTA